MNAPTNIRNSASIVHSSNVYPSNNVLRGLNHLTEQNKLDDRDDDPRFQIPYNREPDRNSQENLETQNLQGSR